MQLYNTLSAEERAIMIDDAGKQRLTLSFYAYAQISNPTQFRNELFLAWNKLEVLGRIYVANEGINAWLIQVPGCRTGPVPRAEVADVGTPMAPRDRG